MKFPLSFKQIIAQNALIFVEFSRSFSMKIRKDKEWNLHISLALLLHSTAWDTISKYQNGSPKVARKAFNIDAINDWDEKFCVVV